MKRKLLFSALVAVASSMAMATTQFEGFEGPTKATIFENSFFNHSLDPNSSSWDPWDFNFYTGTQSIILYPDTDVITFNTTGSEYVSQAQIYVLSAFGGAIVKFNGLDSSNNVIDQTFTYNQGIQDWNLAQSGSQFASITSIEITGFEGVFDDLSVEVVPEPATMSLLALGALAALRKRKK